MLFFIWIAWILRSKPTTALVVPAFLVLIPLVQESGFLPEKLVSFLFYLLLLGPGEEFLFRGYIREMTGSILPQAITSIFLGVFAVR